MASKEYSQNGYALGPVVLEKAELNSINQVIDKIIVDSPGRSNLGKAYNPEKDLGKFNEAHIYSPELLNIIKTPSLGKAIAKISGAKKVQIWATQLLNKPGGSNSGASVGWHQDFQYWQPFWAPNSELFTAWLAFSDVKEESGPVNFIAGSHKWGFLNAGNFFQDINEQKASVLPIPKGETWAESPATMSAGAFSLHHQHTFHGSYPNLSPTPRRSIALHLCTDKATPTPGNCSGYDYAKYLNDPIKCPVIFDQT
jgi:ectoine hydroxylase-related dioxygenase (phytanoyl-CoA dioxygenase family)